MASNNEESSPETNIFAQMRESQEREGVKPSLFAECSTRVFDYEKKDDLRAQDAELGLARIGGEWRNPDYREAYLLGASELVERGVEQGTLDDLAVPAFSLLRHAVELGLKDLIQWALHIHEVRWRVRSLTLEDVERPDNPSLIEHHLTELLDILEEAMRATSFSVPTSFKVLVERVQEIDGEIQPGCRFRYPYLTSKKGVKQSLDKVEPIPLVELCALAQECFGAVFYSFGSGDKAFEHGLYMELSHFDSIERRYYDEVAQLRRELHQIIRSVSGGDEIDETGRRWTDVDIRRTLGQLRCALDQDLGASKTQGWSELEREIEQLIDSAWVPEYVSGVLAQALETANICLQSH